MMDIASHVKRAAMASISNDMPLSLIFFLSLKSLCGNWACLRRKRYEKVLVRVYCTTWIEKRNLPICHLCAQLGYAAYKIPQLFGCWADNTGEIGYFCHQYVNNVSWMYLITQCILPLFGTNGHSTNDTMVGNLIPPVAKIKEKFVISINPC